MLGGARQVPSIKPCAPKRANWIQLKAPSGSDDVLCCRNPGFPLSLTLHFVSQYGPTGSNVQPRGLQVVGSGLLRIAHRFKPKFPVVRYPLVTRELVNRFAHKRT